MTIAHGIPRCKVLSRRCKLGISGVALLRRRRRAPSNAGETTKVQLVILVVLALAAVYWFSGGGFGTDKIFGPPENLPFSRYDDVDVHVIFSFPKGDQSYNLGQVRGASACGSVARNYAAQHNLSTNRDWSYVCCTIEAGSSCYRKIR